MDPKLSRGWMFALLAVTATLLITPAAPAAPKAKAQADVNGGFGPDDRPAFLVISLEPQFDLPVVDKVNGALANQCTDMGSPVALYNIGTFVAGPDIESTRFEGADPIIFEPPIDEATGLPYVIDANHATIVGSFKTTDPADPTPFHLMTPVPDVVAPIPPEVQEAVFNASPFIEPAIASGELQPFPMTVELAYFIYSNQLSAGAQFQDILDSFFATDPFGPLTIGCTSPCEAEGSLHPHDPDDGLFQFVLKLDPDAGKIFTRICLPVSVDIKPGSDPNSINLGSEGVVPVAVLSGNGFSVAELSQVPADLRAVIVDGVEVLAEVSAEKTALQYVDNDNVLDLIVHFRTQDLVDVVLFETTVRLDFDGVTTAHGMCVTGSDTVRIVPPKK
ncbi:MAG: hypothetical protein ACYTEZ_08845 [Planctomycetota bacterium]|jgi:hypothetical protein